MTLETIAEKLASALRPMPCTCIWTGSWPRFKAEVKAHPEHVCSRCRALEDYDLHKAACQSLAEAAKEKS